MDINYLKIQKKLQKDLDKDRYEHTLGVAKTAQMLAIIYGYDSNKAYIAGLLHDCAKNISHKEKMKLCEKNGYEITDAERANPSLLHAKAGSIIAKQLYNINDKEILDAITSHTTGRPAMSLIEKIVFVADYIEPGRPDRIGLLEIRKKAFVSLDDAVTDILRDTLLYLKDTAKAIDPATQSTYDYYRNL